MAQSYILFSSAYRDRLLYPNPADFVVPFGSINNINTSAQNVFLSTNPISYSLPDYNFCWTNFNPNTTDPRQFRVLIVGGSPNAPVVDRSMNRELLGLFPPNQSPPNLTLRQTASSCFNILRGFVLTIGSGPTLQVRDIVGYDPSTATITLRNPFPLSDFNLSTGPIEAEIRNISENNPTDDLLRIFVNGDFLENSATVYFDFEVYLYNISLNEIRLIKKYQPDLQAMDLCDFFGPDWSITDQYWVLSRTAPMALGDIIGLRGGNYYNPSFIDNFAFISRGHGYGAGQVVALVADPSEPMVDQETLCRVLQVGNDGRIERLEITAPSSRPCRSGDRLFVVPVDPDDPPVPDPAVIRVGSTSLMFVIELSIPIARPQDMEGNYLVPILTTPQYSFNQDTNTLHLSPNKTIPTTNRDNSPIDLLSSQQAWGLAGIRRVLPLGGRRFALYTQSLRMEQLARFDNIWINREDLPPYIRNGSLRFLVIQYSYEGVSPLNFTGSQITQSQMSCYEMTVVNLILPNEIINGVQGLLTSAYPYIFLEISNESMPSAHNRILLYSNNPNSTRATFVCSISDVNNPRTSRFLKISSDGAVQTLKFSPFDNLRFRVSLPNGQTFETEKTDTLVPCDPNPRLQISALFEIRRL